ncbi:methyltransferase [Streptomyces albidoflavus]
MNRLTTAWGTHDLTRFPEDPRDQLRAWDAADAYLLRHLAETGVPTGTGDGALVVALDRWGALTTALAAHRPVQISDSHLARSATRANLARAGLGDPGAAGVRLLTTRDTPPERIDVLLIRVPKSLALLEDQLHRLAPALHPGTLVVGTGMVKEIHTSTLRLFERIVGPTRTSLAEQKARLIHATVARRDRPAPSPWPLRYALPDGIGPMSGRTVTNHAGIFCADRLDVGTRFFLGQLPVPEGSARVVDLGCGNGVVGTAVARTSPEAEIVFVDESHQAVASAEQTFRDNAPDPERGTFLVTDGLDDPDAVASSSVDLVLTNPPFHSHQAVTDATARRMFAGARRVLRPGGELWVVANRHLGHHRQLRRLFGNCVTAASDPKFVVLRAVKS